LWPTRTVPFPSIWPAVAGAAIGLVLMHFVALTVNPAWVPFRGGQIFLVTAPAIVARGLVLLWQANRPRLAVAVVAVVVVAGFPTSMIDLYNTQDVTNRGLSPGPVCPPSCSLSSAFHWTIAISRSEQAALDWIRTQTPPAAVVQADPISRGRETWSYIPTFAERRSATGIALSLLPVPEYDERNERVRTIYASHDARTAWQDARALGIDYLYVGAVERAAYAAVGKFEANPDLFIPAFKNQDAAVYALRR
jgi:hypothetical protein